MRFVNEDMLNVTQCHILGKLPDPFRFDDGSYVKSKEDWERRRKEIYKTAIELQYGTIPPKPEVFSVETLYKGGRGRPNSYRITAGTKEKTISFRMQIFNPPENRFEKMPVIVDGDACFPYSFDKEYLNIALNEGIGWVFFDRTELAHDILYEGRRQGALYEIYPEYTFGALGAWAWGYSRCVDALEVLGFADMAHIAFTGHSRGGKTATLAGALDERAFLVNPNETCAGACGCYRIHMKASYLGGKEESSETLADLLHYFDFWMGEGMAEYANKKEELPFDSHTLKAMIAPRVLYVSEAAGDVWANPVGSWQTTMAAKEVFRFLDAEDHLFWSFRPGTHYHHLNDVEMLVNIMLQKLCGAKPDERFYQLPFRPMEPIFDWKAPEK